MAADTWFPFNVGDYLSNTLHLTTRQHGGYLLLILAAWKAGGVLPGGDVALASIAKLASKEWQQDGDTLKAFLTRRGDEWIHERVLFEWNEAQRLSDIKSVAGRAGAKKRWQGRANGKRIAGASVSHTQTDAHQDLQQQEDGTSTDQVERAGAGAPRKPKESSDARPKSHRLPDDWRPSQACRDFATDKGLDPNIVAEAFVDYWTGGKGSKQQRTDWNRTWRVWCERDTNGPLAKAAARPVRATRGGDAFFERLADIRARSLDDEQVRK